MLPCLADPTAAGLGMEDGYILDSQITASTSSVNSNPEYSRLPFISTPNVTTGGWVAGMDDTSQWLQVSLFRQTLVGGVIIQGRQDKNEWVTKYKVATSLDGSTWDNVKDEYGHEEVRSIFPPLDEHLSLKLYQIMHYPYLITNPIPYRCLFNIGRRLT